MENLIVGCEECKITEIVNVIKSSSVISQLSSKLGGIGLALDVPKTTREEVNRKINIFYMMKPEEGLEEFLEVWKTKNADKATLSAFIGVLKKLELNEFVKLLEDHFKPNTSVSNSNDGSNAAEIAKKQKEHIDKNLKDLVHDISLSSLFLATMKQKGIIHDSDIAEINETSNSFKNATVFFQTIQKKLLGQPTIYASLIEILDDEKQSGVAFILRQLDQRYWK